MELDNLRPEVREALQVFDGETVCTCHDGYTSRGMKDPQCNHDLKGYAETLRAELLRLAKVAEDLTFADSAALKRANERAENVAAENAQLRDMAQCMDLLRRDCIAAGAIRESVPPMFYSEAVIALHQRATKAEAELAALKARIAGADCVKPFTSAGGTLIHCSDLLLGKRVLLVVED